MQVQIDIIPEESKQYKEQSVESFWTVSNIKLLKVFLVQTDDRF